MARWLTDRDRREAARIALSSRQNERAEAAENDVKAVLMRMEDEKKEEKNKESQKAFDAAGGKLGA